MSVLHIYLCVTLICLCSGTVIEDLVAEPAKKSESYHKAEGSKHQDEYYAEKGVKDDKGYKHENNYEKGHYGQYGDEHHVKSYEEGKGKKKKDYDEGNRESSHYLEGGSHSAGSHRDKKGHKKGGKRLGFHNKYFKDNFQKQHRFYDNYHKEGSHSKFGNYKAKFAKGETEEKRRGGHKGSKQQSRYGRKGSSSKGHHDDNHKSHRAQQGHESHYLKAASQGKTGDHKEGKQYGYNQKT